MPRKRNEIDKPLTADGKGLSEDMTLYTMEQWEEYATPVKTANGVSLEVSGVPSVYAVILDKTAMIVYQEREWRVVKFNATGRKYEIALSNLYWSVEALLKQRKQQLEEFHAAALKAHVRTIENIQKVISQMDIPF